MILCMYEYSEPLLTMPLRHPFVFFFFSFHFSSFVTCHVGRQSGGRSREIKSSVSTDLQIQTLVHEWVTCGLAVEPVIASDMLQKSVAQKVK